MRKTKVKINDEQLQISSEILRAIAHPLRMQILEFVDKHKTINVNKIYNTLKLEQSITSQHLRILRVAGVVEANRDGKFIYYSLNYSRIAQVIKGVNNFLEEDK